MYEYVSLLHFEPVKSVETKLAFQSIKTVAIE